MCIGGDLAGHREAGRWRLMPACKARGSQAFLFELGNISKFACRNYLLLGVIRLRHFEWHAREMKNELHREKRSSSYRQPLA